MLALQTPLTDAFIAGALEQKRQEPIIMNTFYLVVIAVIMAVVAIICLVNQKRNITNEKKTISLCVMVIVVALGIGGVTFLSSMRKVHTDAAKTAEVWYVMESSVTKLDTEIQTHSSRRKRNGRTYYDNSTTTKYYAKFDRINNNAYLDASEWRSYYLGEKVYLVMNSANKIELIYSMDDYEYTGEKLK